MFNEIKKFMQFEDPNGTWYECTELEQGYMLQTLQEWIEDGLEVGLRVQGFIDYLRIHV